jgi:hypothetical protein
MQKLVGARWRECSVSAHAHKGNQKEIWNYILMEFESIKPAHTGFSDFCQRLKHAIRPDPLGIADCEHRAVDEGYAGILPKSGL